MPKVSTDIPDHQDYITRPIALSITEDIIGHSGLNPNEIIYLGAASAAKNAGSSIDNPTQIASVGGVNQTRLTVEEEFNTDSLLTTGILQGNKRTVFHDDESRVYMVPIRTDATMRLEVVYTCATEAEARDWRNRMRQKLERRLEVSTHAVAYSYPIPFEYVAAIKSVHALRETGPDAYGQRLGVYLRDKFSNKVATRSHLNGKGKQLVIEEAQHDISGVLEFDEIPKPQKEGNVFTISFNYTIRYERPFAMVLDYPLVINGNLVSSDLMPRIDRNLELRMDRAVIHNWFDGAINVARPTQARVGGFSIPSFDTWRVPHPLRNTGSIFKILIVNDPNDPSLILNINDLGEYKLNEDIVALMEESGRMLFEYGHSPVLIQFYQNNVVVSPSKLTFIDGELRLDGEVLNRRDDYHLRISLLTDLSTLSEPAWDLTLRHGRAARSILLALDPTLIQHSLMPPLVNEQIQEIPFRLAIDHINLTSRHFSALGEVDRVRVAFLTVSTSRSS